MSLWERFCRLYGIESLYKNTSELFNYIEKRDVKNALEALTASINDTIHGNKQIYY
jgi:hypothetical protein